MNWKLAVLSLLFPLASGADFTLVPRYDSIFGEEEIANRVVASSRLNGTRGPFGFVVEGFLDLDFAPSAGKARRSAQKGYLQEAYVEMKIEDFYVRVGRQALRWSESWSLPSLDVWTGRRFNRLHFDPLAEQLTHSQGAVFSYAPPSFSVDVALISEVAKTYYPEPFPEDEGKANEELSFGARLIKPLGGFSFSLMGAHVHTTDHYGMTANYAFETWVPKIEFGGSKNQQVDPVTGRYAEDYFVTLGTDVFIGNLILLPQVTLHDFGDLNQRNNDFQSAYYVSMQWNPGKHDWQAQVFYNSTEKDSFASLSYGYDVTETFTVSGFAQNYEGQAGSLYHVYQTITGGFVAGLRLELSGSMAF